MKTTTFLLFVAVVGFVSGQRITTIQLDGVQYFVSRMNPYSPELNYFLAYQYCRSLGLQLASFETKEKAETMTQYLKNAGYVKYDFWTSGNKLGTDMFLWMSTGLPFNATFDYMLRRPGNRPADVPPGTEPQRVARESGDSGSSDGCVAMVAPTLAWEAQDCTLIKDFICEQTRCYYYNYGSIPVSATQGNRRPYITTTTSAPATDDQVDQQEDNKTNNGNDDANRATEGQTSESDPAEENGNTETEQRIDDDETEQRVPDELVEDTVNEKLPEDPVVSRLITTASPASGKNREANVPAPTSSSIVTVDQPQEEEEEEHAHHGHEEPADSELANRRSEHIPDITSLFTSNPAGGSQMARKESVFEGLQTREIHRSPSRSASSDAMKVEHRESGDYIEMPVETESPNNGLEDAHTVGPYDSVQDYVNDQPDIPDSPMMKDQDDDTSTILPEAEPAYRYNIKVRTNGKVLDPPSK